MIPVSELERRTRLRFVQQKLQTIWDAAEQRELWRYCSKDGRDAQVHAEVLEVLWGKYATFEEIESRLLEAGRKFRRGNVTPTSG